MELINLQHEISETLKRQLALEQATKHMLALLFATTARGIDAPLRAFQERLEYSSKAPHDHPLASHSEELIVRMQQITDDVFDLAEKVQPHLGPAEDNG